MNAALRTTGQIPDYPGVDVTKEDLAFFCFFFESRVILQDPLDLHTREVGCQGQTNFGAETILTAILCEFVANFVGTGILPDDGVENRFASGFFPYNCGFALVGDTDSSDFFDIYLEFIERTIDNILGRLHNLQWIVLNPAWFGVNLFVFFLIITNHFARIVKDHKTGAGGSLIDCSNIFSHNYLLLNFVDDFNNPPRHRRLI